ncbi:MAG TPA: single-stranded DNA-binding protein [Clostridiaceae bacterium]|nr:single-stranded DNA-binding protein [Clostridiaceae bacterium]
MNKAILMGRLTRDPELRTTSNNVSVSTFTLAIDRNYKTREGERLTDFIPIVVWRQNADFVHRYFVKGQRMLVVGSIQPRSYVDQNGQKRYVTEVVADEVYFADSKRESSDFDESGDKFPFQSEDREWKKAESSDDDFFPGSDEDSTSLPFDMN